MKSGSAKTRAASAARVRWPPDSVDSSVSGPRLEPEPAERGGDARLQGPVGVRELVGDRRRPARRGEAGRAPSVAPNRSATVSRGSAWTAWRSMPSVPVIDTLAGLRRQIAGDQLQQRGLADAVAADEAGAFAAEAEIEIGKERAGRQASTRRDERQ